MSTSENKGSSMISILLDGMRNYLKFKFVCILICLVIFVVILVFAAIIPPKYTEITDVADYGNFTGTGADSFVDSYINSFFPERIEPYFSDIHYSYKAENTDTYGFEAYLEFQINDRTKFDEYISGLKQAYNFQESHFCSGFQECNIENVLDINLDYETEPDSVFFRPILRAKIRKILYSTETQTVIYSAIGVYDGGGIGTNYLNVYFDRFQIDPAIYVQTADPIDGVAPYGI